MPKMQIGSIAFYAGLGLALVMGVASTLVSAWLVPLTIAMLVAGLIVGLMNVQRSERVLFIVSALGVATFTGIFSILPSIGGMLSAIFLNIAAFAGAAGAVVALKAMADAGSK